MRLLSSDKQSLDRLTTTVGLFVLATTFLFTACDTTVNEEGDPVSVAGDSTDASTTINNPPPGPYDVTGNVTGRVVDQATNEPISGVAVSIDALNIDDEPLSDTTNAAGEFSFANVPAQESTIGGGAASGDYTIHFNTEEADGNYQDNLRVEATLQYARNEDGGDGDPNNLGASVTLPLAELSGSISASAYVTSDATGSRLPAAGVPITLHQTNVLEYDADGNTQEIGTVEVATDTTGDDGSFGFDNIPEGLSDTEYSFEWTINGDQTVFNGGIREDIPMSSAGNPNVNLGDLDVTSQVENLAPFQVVAGPDLNAGDLSTQMPEWTFAFNRGLAENDFTTAENLAEELDLTNGNAKALDAGGAPTLDVSFNADRDTMTVTPTEELRDGYENYQLNVSGVFGNSQFVGAAFQQGEVNADGVPDYDAFGSGVISFSVGVDQSQPAPPEIVVEDLTPYSSPGNPVDTTDYTNTQITIDHRIVDTSEVDLCEGCDYAVEVFASYSGNSFQRVDQSNVVEFGEDDFVTTVSGDPFQAEDGSGEYSPVQVYAKVTSMNGVESANSDTLTIGDNETVSIDQAFYNDTDGDGTVDELEVRFDEPINKSSVDLSDFTINDTAGGSASDLGSIQRIQNEAFGSRVIISVTTDNSADDEVVVDGLTDLAGNGVNNNQDTDSSL